MNNMGYRARHTPTATPRGYDVRELAANLIAAVLVKGRALEIATESALDNPIGRSMEPRDRAMARLITATVLRRLGQIDAVIAAFLERPLPQKQGNLTSILRSATAQLLFLHAAPHAVINIAVEQVRRDNEARRFDKLANAVLRRISENGIAIIAAQDAVLLNIPDWIWTRWVKAYGADTARRIAESSLAQAGLDISAKSDVAHWAGKLAGTMLRTGTIRLEAPGRVDQLPGFVEGEWWVQDAAAALPPALLGDVNGMQIADLCAAPGGKTASLCARGAIVTAVDHSASRLARVGDNLKRLHFEANLVESDASTWQPGRLFDAVLLDVPCTATGTIRRHPDILRLKRPSDMSKLVGIQAKLLKNAVRLAKPGGLVVYCSCSLEPEEGVGQINRLLTECTTLARVPVNASELEGDPSWITSDGDLRTLPFHNFHERAELSGMDGFFAARLKLR